jgi:hypothetical protein
MAIERYIMMTTHRDSHGDRMTLSALKSAAKQINGKRKIRAGINHDWTFPPAGRYVDALVEKRQDGEHQLVATRQPYDEQSLVRMPDGSVGILESFKLTPTPFIEAAPAHIDLNELCIDYNNFSNYQEAEEFIRDVREATQVNFKDGAFGRKALINDPEIVLAITKLTSYALFSKLAAKTPEKLKDKIAEELISFYELVKQSSFKAIKSMLPKNRKTTYIIRSCGDITIELIIRTSDAKVIIESVSEEKLVQCRAKIHEICAVFSLEKLNLLYNEEKGIWEFNYLLTQEGKSLSTPKAYNARQKAFTDLTNRGSDGEANDHLKLQYNSTGCRIS